MKWRKTKRPSTSGRNPRSLLWRQIFTGVVLSLLIGVLGIGIWYGSRIPALTISEIEIYGGETIDHDDIRSAVKEELTGSYYKLVPKQFTWTYPRERIGERLKEIPRIKNIRQERPDSTRLVIRFDEYVPYALWCSDGGESGCVFLDAAGYGFSAAPVLSGGALLRYVIAGEAAAVGQAAFSPETMRRTSDFVATAHDEFGFNIITVEQTALTELTYHIAGGGVIKTSLDVTLEETIENLGTILQSDQFAHLAPGNFQYIDLRFGNKVFVNEEIEIAPTPDGEGATTTTASSTAPVR